MAKNIILCTDGTGNAEGRRIGTNVGRIFKAVDLSENQVAFYDDGVGTEENKYLRALGGAFGLGLKRNIVDLYEFLCRNYEPGDQIYIFGFSRGAYTARAVAGLICACGVIDLKKVSTGKELRKVSKKAYKACRHSRYTSINKVLSRNPVQNFKDDWTTGQDVPVRFVGVWDTVDAVGLPIDEVATMFDWFFRFSFTNSDLSPLVQKGCQALAIDDQRQTFHPDLWNADETKGNDGCSRIEQVFFAGMHSNVGGGYPKDELSYVPLKWMMAKAASNGLRFVDSIRDEYERNVNPNGKIYDSRAGVKLFYRFKPRNIHELAKDAGIEKVQVHELVADRIFGKVEDYGPANLRSDFMIVDDHGMPSARHGANLTKLAEANKELDANGVPYHQEGGKEVSRFQFALTRVADMAWWRRAIHVTVVATILAIASFPWWPRIEETPVNCDGIPSCALEPILGLMLTISGGKAEIWTKALSANPVAFVCFASILIGCGLLHLFLKPRMKEAGLRAWRVVTRDPPPKIGKNVFLALAYNIRRAKWATTVAWFTRRVAIPGFFLLLFVSALGWTVRGAGLSIGNFFGWIQHECEASLTPSATSNACINTKIQVEKGRDYTIALALAGDWIDKTIPTSQPNGFSSSEGGAIMHLFGPFRRHVDQRWFQLMAKIGDDGEPFPIKSMSHEFTPTESGDLFLYVNDVYCPICPDPWVLYGNNSGSIGGDVIGDGQKRKFPKENKSKMKCEVERSVR